MCFSTELRLLQMAASNSGQALVLLRFVTQNTEGRWKRYLSRTYACKNNTRKHISLEIRIVLTAGEIY